MCPRSLRPTCTMRCLATCWRRCALGPTKPPAEPPSMWPSGVLSRSLLLWLAHADVQVFDHKYACTNYLKKLSDTRSIDHDLEAALASACEAAQHSAGARLTAEFISHHWAWYPCHGAAERVHLHILELKHLCGPVLCWAGLHLQCRRHMRSTRCTGRRLRF